MTINFSIVRKDEEGKLKFVEIYRYEGNSADKLSKVIEKYWTTKPTPLVIDRTKYYIRRVFTATLGPMINMG